MKTKRINVNLQSIKYPEFKQMHFWAHHTLDGMQYELKHILENTKTYSLERLNDTTIDSKVCYHISLLLEGKTTTPGFAFRLEDSEGSISKTCYFIDKLTNYPVGRRGESYSEDNPDQKVFIAQKYYDVQFNRRIDGQSQFDTSVESLAGFDIQEVKPE